MDFILTYDVPSLVSSNLRDENNCDTLALPFPAFGPAIELVLHLSSKSLGL